MDALAEQLELLVARRPVDDDLAVEDVAPRREAELGEVAREVAPVARLELHGVAVDENDGAEAVPLGLVRPAVTGRQARARARELGKDGGLEGKGHGLGP